MTDRTLRVGLVGAGSIAQVAELPALAAQPGAVIAGLVTANEASRARNLAHWPIERGYESLEEMIAAASLDAVFVLTPMGQHGSYVETALRAGLDVFCEKPLCMSLADARRLADLADECDRLLMVGFNRRYAPVFVKARAAFGPAGPQFCLAQKSRPDHEYRTTLESAIHLVDLLRWFCGEATEVAANALADDPFFEHGSSALLRFEHGAIGVMVIARTAGEWDERLDAYGGGLSVHVAAPDTVDIVRASGTHRQRMRSLAMGWADASDTFGFSAEVAHFLECIRLRQRPRTDGREAVRTQALVDQILVAARLPTSDSQAERGASGQSLPP
jgi:virulence factor